MIKNVFILSLLLFFAACSEKPLTQNLDGKALLESKCASCHDINMPPKISDNELAPPIMAVSFHVHNFVKPTDESQRTSKAIEFVTDYIFNPSLKKSFCDEDSLERYGLMPSQKNKLTKDEAKAIALYMFTNFTQENLIVIQKKQAAFDALDAGEKIAIKHRCLGCHGVNIKKVGPSLVEIADKYSQNKDEIIKSIRNGSKGIWSKGAVMPAFEKMEDEELEILTEWILKTNKS
ncbi:MAG: c-type cytochrome [Sulfurimonas sp.]|uniref:c-type cytochrome n=1 Tax=Sulfurimonas sp. TaxID=2022749 RepID=UPI0025D4573F|nr:c-type cytochrome [Sulfurimonas sp.]MCK9490943.1 c-type cytochrome [Sulfurimonas sp.]